MKVKVANKEQQELIGKARLLLSSLDMIELYSAVNVHGEIEEITFNSFRCEIIFKDGFKKNFRRL